jgi:predicted Zn finger-like uncharacterized protein
MLLTTCSNCGAQFKVLPEHLNVRQGRVMCGRCRHVFNAFESLKRVEDEPPSFTATMPLSAIAPSALSPDTAATPVASPAAPAMTPYAASAVTMASTTPASASIHSGDLDIEFVSEPEFSPTPLVTPATPAAAAGALSAFSPRDEALPDFPPAFRAHEPDLPEELATALDDLGPIHAVEPPPEAEHVVTPDPVATRVDASRAAIASIGPLVDALTQTTRTVTPETAPVAALVPAPAPARVEPVIHFSTMNGPNTSPPASSPLELTDPPGAEPLSLTKEEAGSKKWIALACVAALVLLALVAFNFRNTIVQSYPQMRPAFAGICSAIGCKLQWGRDVNAIAVTSAELVEAPGKPGKLIASATLANRGAVKQDLPSVELRLTNNTNQVVISRILEPADYLGRAVTAEDGIAANGDLSINLNIEIPPNIAASGYEFLPFYR